MKFTIGIYLVIFLYTEKINYFLYLILSITLNFFQFEVTALIFISLCCKGAHICYIGEFFLLIFMSELKFK